MQNLELGVLSKYFVLIEMVELITLHQHHRADFSVKNTRTKTCLKM